MASFTVDLRGRVNNMKDFGEYKYLWPVFEAVVNAIQSIEESPNNKNGVIRIYAQRTEPAQMNVKNEAEVMPFEAFTIEDNGEGFNDKNYNSFLTADSSLKIRKGCKGIGRFLWLKAFEKVEVSSNYLQDNEWRNRKFTFSLDGLYPDVNINQSDCEEYKTKIKLCDFKERYKNRCSKNLETICHKIVEHCLTYFISDNCPKIFIFDNLGDSISLNDYFNNNIKDSLHQDHFKIHNKNFILYHIRMPEGVSNHELHLCANKREVKSLALSKYIKNLNKKIIDVEGNSFYYVGYLSGEYLDGQVNSSRTSFNLMDDDTQLDLDDSISYPELMKHAQEYIILYLDEYLKEREKTKKQEIDNYVRYKQPKYRVLLNNRPELYDNVEYGLPEKSLEIALYQEQQKWEYELKKTGEDIQSKLKKSNIKDADIKEQMDLYFKSITEISKISLTEHVVKRRIIIDMLAASLEYKEDGKSYFNEDVVHSIICPMKATSDEISIDDINLWLIDERLSYHYFLSSDKEMRNIPVVETIDSSKDKRMDIAIFNRAMAFTESSQPYNTVTIIEFKKPMRKDLKPDDKNPINQVLGYIDDIKSGKKIQSNGRPFGNVTNAAFYCYVIADLTEAMHFDAKNASLWITPDGEGYFGYNQTRNAYIEVISYNKLLNDAEKRNKILFEKLFSPNPREIINTESNSKHTLNLINGSNC